MLQRIKETKEEIFTKKYVHYFIWLILVSIFIYLSLISIFKDEALPPNGHLFHMFCLFIFTHFMAKIFHIISLPSLLGMLTAGIIYGNLIEFELNKSVVSNIRSLALLIILLRAGLHLVPEYLSYLSYRAIRVIVIPFFIETFVVSGASILLFKFNIMWALLIGFVLAAVSPAVVVPCMIRIQQLRLSEGKGIPTLNIAAASIDDVLSVTGFNIFLYFAITDESSCEKSETLKYLQGPLQILIGLAFGLIMGFVLWFIPERYDEYDKDNKKYNLSRFLLLVISGTFALFGSIYIEMEAAGPLALLVMAFVATIKWRKNEWDEENEHGLKIVWLIFKRFLFCLIGCELKFSTLDTEIVVKALACLFIGIALKLIVSYLLTYNIGLNRKERLFVACSWLPKATVQAAIGPTALAVAITDQDKHNGKIILTAAALSILITAPIGAILMDFLCTRLLSDPDIDNSCNNLCPMNGNQNCHHSNIITIDNNNNNNTHSIKQTKINSPILNERRFDADFDL